MEHAIDAASQLDEQLAQRLSSLRREREWSLDDLVAISGVSKGNLSRIENGQVSPTASTLAKLSAAYGMSMSRLLALAEQQGEAVLKRADQQVWDDPEGGFHRRAVSTSGPDFACDLIECELERGRTVEYDAPTRPGQEHHIYCLEGALSLTVDGTTHHLSVGDSLKFCLHGASSFRAGGRGRNRYIVVVR